MRNYIIDQFRHTQKVDHDFTQANIASFLKEYFTIKGEVDAEKFTKEVQRMVEINKSDQFAIYSYGTTSTKEVYEDTDFTCTNILCRSKKIVIYQQQIRSGDEGATTCYKCTACNNNWY